MMKQVTKKFFSLLLVLVMLCTVSVTGFAAYEPDSGKLSYNEDGKFTILQFADTQDDDEPEAAMIAFINEALDKVQPDLVVFTGDNVITENFTVGADAIIKPVADRGIPFTLTYGNHDYECCKISREEMLTYYQSFDGCLAYDAAPEIYGCGNHNLLIYGSDGSNVPVSNLWMIDSNDYRGEDYDYVHEDQIQWYKDTSLALENTYGKKIPSIVFQHIIVPEIYEIFTSAQPTSVLSKIGLTVGIAEAIFTPESNFNGYMFEFPCPPAENSGEFDAFVERGDVIAAVFGHDHANSFVCTVDGIDLVQTPGCTYESYGNDLVRGARIITLDENAPETYETSVLTYRELAQQDGSAITDDTENTKLASFMFFDFINEIIYVLKRILAIFVR